MRGVQTSTSPRAHGAQPAFPRGFNPCTWPRDNEPSYSSVALAVIVEVRALNIERIAMLGVTQAQSNSGPKHKYSICIFTQSVEKRLCLIRVTGNGLYLEKDVQRELRDIKEKNNSDTGN